jgi:hypothetical protein
VKHMQTPYYFELSLSSLKCLLIHSSTLIPHVLLCSVRVKEERQCRCPKGSKSSLLQCFQGFLHRPREDQGRILAWAHSSWNLLAKLERSLLLVQVPLYLFTCCLLETSHIYTFILNWFSPGGFYPGSC